MASTSSTALKRIRKRLGLNFRDDTVEFWQGRLEYLELLTHREFAAKHDVDPAVVFVWRRRLCRKFTRDIWWLRKTRVRKILLSDFSLSQAHRLQKKVKEGAL